VPLVVAADGADHRPAIELRQHQVEDHERRLLRFDCVERRGSVARGDDPVALALEVRPDEANDLRVVVDDEDRSVGEWRRLHHEHHRRRYGEAMTER
jgi:hypothetical protein